MFALPHRPVEVDERSVCRRQPDQGRHGGRRAQPPDPECGSAIGQGGRSAGLLPHWGDRLRQGDQTRSGWFRPVQHSRSGEPRRGLASAGGDPRQGHSRRRGWRRRAESEVSGLVRRRGERPDANVRGDGRRRAGGERLCGRIPRCLSTNRAEPDRRLTQRRQPPGERTHCPESPDQRRLRSVVQPADLEQTGRARVLSRVRRGVCRHVFQAPFPYVERTPAETLGSGPERGTRPQAACTAAW